MSYPVFIVCRDRLTSLVGLLDWLERVGNADEVYLLDQASTYPPLLDFYQTTRHHVIHGPNLGHRAGWLGGHIMRLAGGRRFIYTDPDLLPTEDCPNDAITRMAAVLKRDRHAVKCGFGIKIDDIAEWCRAGIHQWESRFWQDWSHTNKAWRAAIDTTFALYNPQGANRFRYKPAYRLPDPYLIRHLPWYVNPDELELEEAYYVAHADQTSSNYARYVMTGTASPAVAG